MMSRTLLALVSLLSIFLSGALAAAEEPGTEPSDAKGIALFEEQIEPVLVKQCYECHSKNGKEVEGGLELDSPSGMLRGGDSGPALVSHEIEKSLLLRALRHEKDVSEMPPKKKLSDEVIAAFEEWIRLGAPDTREDLGPTTKEERLAKRGKFWLKWKPKAPKPVADASRRTLVRRVYFDLIGLPPIAGGG